MVTDNEKKTLDYGAFLTDLEAKRAVLDQAIASIRAVMASGALAVNASDSMPGMVASMSVALHGGEVPAGAFNGKSIPEAARLYLSIVKTKRTTKEIADALREGGMETRGKNFEIIVGSALYRISKGADAEIVRVKGAWGLAEWWPVGVRVSEKPNGRKTKRARKQKLAKGAATTADPRVAEGVRGRDGHIRFSRLAPAPVESKRHEKPQERIAEFLRANPSQVYTPSEVSQVLNIETRTVAPTLGRLAAGKVIEKVESGKYRAAHG